MELVYAWIERFRNYKDIELNFSDKFTINYDKDNTNIRITRNKSYIAMYPEYITNINAIVGKNGVGKTNLLDLLGLRTNDRNKNNAEFEVRYKNKKGFKLIPDDVEAEIKHSIYFFIYYMGKDDNDQDLFCFEGNDIESFEGLIYLNAGLDIEYWKSKYWFAFICNYKEGKLIHKFDLNVKLGEFRTESHKDGIRHFGDYKSEQDKLVIISLRENLSNKYYDYNSTKPEDDYKISIPRRIAKFQSKLLAMKVEMLYKQIHKNNRLVFQNDYYTLKITYNSDFLTDGNNNENKLVLLLSYNDLNGREKDVCKVLESFIQYFYSYINNREMELNIEEQLPLITNKRKSLKGYTDYYLEIVERLSNIYMKDENFTQHILKYYSALSEELSTNKSFKFQGNNINIDITKKVNIKEILKVIHATVDEKIISGFNEMFTVFSDFFNYSIESLSDGESAYLGFFSSLYEQITLLTPTKEKYIILLDEPEVRMHPELTRNFIHEMVLFLRDLSEDKKRFQVVISTHSPFILSDIQSNNIIYLEKNNTGYCKPVKKILNTFGANIHTLFKNGFFMTSTMGEFASSKIKEVISSIDDCDIKDVTEEQKREWLYIINSIGEPLIKNRLMKMYNDKFLLNYTDLYIENTKLKKKLKRYEEPRRIIDTIEVLKKQIEELQMHVKELGDKQNDKD